MKWGHMQGSRREVMCKGHEVKSCTGGMQVAQSDLHLRMGGVIMVRTLQESNVGVSW